MSTDEKLNELQSLRARIDDLEREITGPPQPWQPKEYYTVYYATTGFMLGAIAAASSLVFNIIGSSLFAKHPLELIRVYLTFPMGAQALNYDTVNNGLIMAIGCCLYMATGMVYGILFEIVLTRFANDASWAARFTIVTALAIAIWLLNFYGILSWLQPLLFGGRWIIDSVPWWVAATTHLVFGWTMLVVYPLGRYTQYRPVPETT